jgi:hypothetical protein
MPLGGGAGRVVEREQRGDDLGLGEDGAVFLGRYERTDQIGPGRVAAVGDDIGDELHLPHQCVAARLSLLGGGGGVAQPLGVFERGPELLLSVGGDADHLRGDCDGERKGQLGDEVE